MIRRGLWLAAGAVTGIYGYRRVSAVGRRLSAGLDRTRPAVDPAQGAALARRGSRGAIGLARETFRFTRDVREGMELYKARHSAPAGPTLGARGRETLGARGRETNDQTNHDPRPKDGR